MPPLSWRVSLESGEYDRRDLIVAQSAFYTGARATWKVLGYLAEDDEPDELIRLIEKRARQLPAVASTFARVVACIIKLPPDFTDSDSS